MTRNLQNTIRKNLYEKFTDRIWSFLHFCYVLVGNSSMMTSKESWTKQKRSHVRIVLFCFWTLYMLIMNNQNLYLKKDYFKYHILIFALVLLEIVFVSKERKLAARKWDSPIARWFLVFWLWVCVSDFIVVKRFRLVGMVMLLVVGLFFLVWQHMEHMDDILWDFIHALELSAAVGVFYNMFFRIKYDGLLYNGYMSRASDFGVFSAFLFLVFSVDVYECWKKGNMGMRMGFSIWGTGISVFQVLLSGKEIAIFFTVLMMAAELFLWTLVEHRHVSGATKKVFIYLILTFCFILIYYFAVKNLPFKLDTMICYKGEKFESNKNPSVIAILKESGIRAYRNVQFHMAGNRIWIWKEYVKRANLFGHKAPNLVALDRQQIAQNHILQIIYRYGIVAALPYVMMFYIAGKKAIQGLHLSGKTINSIDILAAGTFLFWWIVGFFGNVEYPCYQPAWLMVYLMFGRYMEKTAN